MQVEQGLNMSAKFKDSKIAKLEKAIKDGHVGNPGDIICDTIESLKHCILKHESKEMALRVCSADVGFSCARLLPAGICFVPRMRSA
jgi:hypothetical protein